MPISDHVTVVREAVAEARERIAAARARGGHGQEVTLIAVTKTHGPEAVEAAYAAGVEDVGENRVQEAERKMAQVTVPVRWHLIGHLQTNKAAQVHRFHLLHSLDRDRLANALQEEMRRRETVLDVLVQVNVSGEASKGGYEPAALPALADRLHELRNLRVRGVMTMAPFDAEEATLRHVFAGAREARAELQRRGHEAPVLSMGMSGDFEIAVEEGATHVRLGTMLFGHRG
ncbi:MAG: YggS family pyridoxal phosphate-dependent enzyme [Gemmatimonadaceae bacterium]|jgi:PLP dependent protein|nr:YggS family pyridoxal phosphate-dependent enzyme [Gemmatimonadaceae bacterium]MBX9854704.1 YggS family pyridoxal phosphate-dependent enzyme [Gemmatimonadaceae bacterium]